jgi:hypothetical protein
MNMATRKTRITVRYYGKDWNGTWYLTGRSPHQVVTVEVPGLGKKATQLDGDPPEYRAGSLLRELIRDHRVAKQRNVSTLPVRQRTIKLNVSKAR